MVFTHVGLVPEHECYDVCDDAWSSYVLGNLRRLIETGSKDPAPLGFVDRGRLSRRRWSGGQTRSTIGSERS